MTTTDVRCPAGKLLAKMRLSGETAHVNANNLMEIHCRDCTRHERQRTPEVKRVIHAYNFIGELVETFIE